MSDQIFFMENRLDEIETLNSIYKMIDKNEIDDLKSQIKAFKTWYKEHETIKHLISSQSDEVYDKINDKTLFYLHGLRNLAEIKTHEELSSMFDLKIIN